MGLFFVWVMRRHEQYAHAYARLGEFPEFYSLPHRLTTIFYYAFGTIVGLIVPGILGIRLLLDGTQGWGAVYGYPDPQVCNTLTKYATLSFLAFMMAKREALRESLYKVILWPYSLSVIASALWLLIGGMLFDVSVRTRTGTFAAVDWYYMLNVGGNGMYGDSSAQKAQRVVDGTFRVEGFDNVFVADASLFPSTITVNPQWTIMALSSLAAKSVLAHAS